MFESREDPTEFLTAAETGRVSPAGDRPTTARPALPLLFATLERRLREPPSGQGRRPVPDGGRSPSRVTVPGRSRMNARTGGEGHSHGSAPRLNRSACGFLKMKEEPTWRTLAASGLAVAAVLSLAACGGSGNSGPKPTLGLDEIRELTGLSVPVETGPEQQARQQEIYARADSLILSTTHVEKVLPDETRMSRVVSECSGSECSLLDPVTGATDTFSIDEVELVLGDAEAIGSAHGITLTSESVTHMDVDMTLLGAWMGHGWFGLNSQHGVREEFEWNGLYAAAGGDLTDRPLTGSATWLGLMVGTPIAGDDRGDRLVGTAAFNYDMAAGGLDAGFSGIKNIDRGTAHSVETVIFSDLEVGSDGTFARGQSGARIQGGFYGPGHAEAAGIFEQSDIVGAFGAKRQ